VIRIDSDLAKPFPGNIMPFLVSSCFAFKVLYIIDVFLEEDELEDLDESGWLVLIMCDFIKSSSL
jgi:hypothetical protein